MSYTDQYYLEKLKKGSYEAFKSLYERYVGLLYGYTYELTHSKSFADDLVQETFIKVWLHRESIKPELSFKSYLFRIAKNQLIDEFRKKMNDSLFEEYLFNQDHLELSENNIEIKIDFDEFNTYLQEAKKKLTPRQREIFELSKEAGLSATEIADKLQINKQSVYNQLSITISILQKEMKDYFLLFVLLFLS